MSNGRQRKDEFVGTIVDESTFGTDPATGALNFSIADVDLSSIRQAEVEDPSYVTDGGMHETIVGVWHNEIGVQLSVKMEGIQSSPTSPNPAVATAQTELLESVFQSSAVLTKTGAASGVPTTTEVITDVAGSHAITGIGIAAFEYNSVYYARPYTESSDTLTLLMALPGAPTAGDDILGGAIVQYDHDPSTLLSKTIRFIGNDNLQTRYTHGSVTTLAIPEVGPQEVPMMDFTIQAATGTRNPSPSPSRPSVTTPRGRVFSGSEVLIAPYGTTAVPTFCASRVNITKIRDAWLPDECGNLDAGIDAWNPAKNAYEVTITVPHNVVPTDLGGTAATWYEAWTSGETQWHLMVNYGQKQPGYSCSFYFPNALLKFSPDAEVNEQDGRTLTWVCSTPIGATENEIIACQW